MKKHRVLLDLAVTLFGYSGIPQDTRTMFLAMCQSEKIDLTGLISGMHSNIAACKLGSSAGNQVEEAENLAYFILALKKEPRFENRILQKLSRLIRSVYFLKKAYHLYPYRNEFLDFLWREAFGEAVSSEYRELVLKQNFLASNFSKFYLKARLLFGLSAPVLNTQGYDFMIVQDGMPMCPILSPGTIPIMRYHDLVPLTYADTMANTTQGPRMHAKGVLSSQKNGAVFVCDSPHIEHELLNIAPALEGRTFVIPVSVIPNSSYQKTTSDKPLYNRIISERLSSSHPVSPPSEAVDNYIISVSTIEPRKNFITLIRAWEKVRYEKDPSLKLVIVGSLGWKFTEVWEIMKPHIESGRILHLEKVPTWELNVLYSNARAFVFPTYYEGFGITPVEASLAGCPMVVSDIPTLRWVMKDAALYGNPHDAFSFSHAIERLLYSDEAASLSAELIEKGRINAERFSLSSVSAQWENLFDKLSGNRYLDANK